jgi:hypothetical protein
MNQDQDSCVFKILFYCVQLPFRFRKGNGICGIILTLIEEETGMYPMLKQGTSIYSCEDEETGEITYWAANKDEEEFEISERLYGALLRLDGTAPLQMGDETYELTAELEKYGIIRTSRYEKTGRLTNTFTLFPIGPGAARYEEICRFLNRLLPFAAVIWFAVGVHTLLHTNIPFSDDLNLPVFYGLIFFSLFAHEGGHLIAGIANGCEFSEMGILLLWILPIGAYVAKVNEAGDRKKESVQLYLAGVEADLMLAGVFFALAAEFGELQWTVVEAGIVNVIMIFLNLLLVKGLDGEGALSAFLEIDSISDTAMNWMKDRNKRRKLFTSGLTGYVCLLMFALCVLSYVLYGAYLILIGMSVFL